MDDLKEILIVSISIFLFIKVIKNFIKKKNELKSVGKWNRKSMDSIVPNYIFLGIGALATPLFLWVTFLDLTMPEETRLRNIEKNKQKQFLDSLSVTCYQFSKARQECATAGSYSQCMEIKGGGNPNYSSYINICSEDGKIR